MTGSITRKFFLIFWKPLALSYQRTLTRLCPFKYSIKKRILFSPAFLWKTGIMSALAADYVRAGSETADVPPATTRRASVRVK